jgi:hypothetical protein
MTQSNSFNPALLCDVFAQQQLSDDVLGDVECLPLAALAFFLSLLVYLLR